MNADDRFRPDPNLTYYEKPMFGKWEMRAIGLVIAFFGFSQIVVVCR